MPCLNEARTLGSMWKRAFLETSGIVGEVLVVEAST